MSDPISRPFVSETWRWVRFGMGLIMALIGGVVVLGLMVSIGYFVLNRLRGGPPWPSLLNLLPYGAVLGVLPLCVGVLLMRDESDEDGVFNNRRLRRIALGAVLFVIAVGVDLRFGPRSLFVFSKSEKLQLSPVDKAPATIISPHLALIIPPGTNLAWCGTFQLVWNETCQLTGGPLELVPDHPLVPLLNRQDFKREYLDEASYVTMAGFVKDDIAAKLSAAVKEKFGDRFMPKHLPDNTAAERPQDILAYACLWKKLKFPVEFERLEDGLKFEGATVPGFGMGEYKPAHDSMAGQVSILDYAGENDFIIELKTDSAGDRLILAKVHPGETLGSIVVAVQKRVASGTPVAASRGDELRVPYFNFDLVRRYHELEDAALKPASAGIAKDLRLISAVQSIWFQLNEKGVELESEAQVAFGCARAATPVPAHRLIFDRPFLVVLQRKDAAMPYFALWVENAELFARQ